MVLSFRLARSQGVVHVGGDGSLTAYGALRSHGSLLYFGALIMPGSLHFSGALARTGCLPHCRRQRHPAERHHGHAGRRPMRPVIGHARHGRADEQADHPEL